MRHSQEYALMRQPCPRSKGTHEGESLCPITLTCRHRFHTLQVWQLYLFLSISHLYPQPAFGQGRCVSLQSLVASVSVLSAFYVSLPAEHVIFLNENYHVVHIDWLALQLYNQCHIAD